jgi:hypothetical protein
MPRWVLAWIDPRRVFSRSCGLYRLRGFPRATRASAAIEFALVLPPMLLFMGGIVEIGRAYQVYSAVNQLATRYAIVWADCSDYVQGSSETCTTELAHYTSTTAMQNIVPQLTNSISLRMMPVSMSGSTATVLSNPSPTGATLTAAELAIAQQSIRSGDVGVVVTVSYNHSLVYFQTLMAPIFKNIMNSSGQIPFSFTVAQDRGLASQ